MTSIPVDTKADLIRAIAKTLTHTVRPPDERQAIDNFYLAVHDRRCPACGNPSARPVDERHVRCPTCPRPVSLTATTPWRCAHAKLVDRVAAIWHVHVDTETTSARAFSRRASLRYETALLLLREARSALIHERPRHTSAVLQILGGVSRRNRADVALTIDDETGALVACRADEAPPHDGAAPAIATAWLGRLRAWLVDVFRGVTRTYLDLYIAEHNDRWRRVRALERALTTTPPGGRSRAR